MAIKRLFDFRISKYNSALRENNIYPNNEWTSISDIGKIFNGIQFTYSEYESIENKYLSFIKQVCEELSVSQMRITDLENHFGNCPFMDRAELNSIDDIIGVARDCLREKYWCKLYSPGLSFHFGYDYYLYVCSSLKANTIHVLANSAGLFVETIESPYK